MAEIAAVGWAISTLGWIASPITTKLLNHGFALLGFNESEKLRDLEERLLPRLELMWQQAERIPPGQRGRVEQWARRLKSAFYDAEDILDVADYHRLQKQTASHGGQPCSTFMVYAMSHKGKATAPETSYNPDDPPEAYSNSSVHTRLTDYTEAARAVHGADFDPANEGLDGSLVMRVGGGKKHRRYWLGDGVIDSSSTPTLSQLRAQTTSGSVPIRPSPSPSQSRVTELEARLEREREERKLAEAQMRSQMEARLEAQAKQMQDLITFMASQSMQVPATLMAPPPPSQNTDATPPPSAGSNNPQTPGWNTPGGQGGTASPGGQGKVGHDCV